MSSEVEKELLEQNKELHRRLDEAEGTLRALRNGEVDAIVATGPNGDQIYTLHGADALYRLMVQNMAEGAATLLPDGLVLFSNEQFACTLGIASSNLIGASIHNFIHPQDAHLFASLLDGSATVAPHIRLVSPARERQEIPVRITASHLTLDDAKYVCLVVMDLSEQEKRNQELAALVDALRQSEYFLERTGRMAGIGGWELNIGTGVLYWSSETYRIYGVPSNSQPDFASAMLFFSPNDRPRVEAAVQQCLSQGTGWNLDLDLDRADGSRITVRSIGSAEFAAGKPVRLMGTVQDITAIKLSEARLREAIEKAELANRAKSDFLANMSHEIRTPMNAILGLTQAALRANPAAKQQAYLRKIGSASESLLHIINDILDFSKIEAGMLQMENIPFSLSASLHQVSELLSFKAQQKELSLEINIAPNVPGTLSGDPLRLEQILINLISNAIKFSEKGRVVVTVDAEPPASGKARLTFSVRDHGIGISPEQISTLFQSFSQADASTTRKYGGTGLGLAISKHLAERMGGSIAVQSQPGNGSTFVLTANFEIPSHSIDLSYSTTHSPSKHALIVEGDHQDRKLLADMLTAVGFAAEAIDTSDFALSKLTEGSRDGRPFDLVVIDERLLATNGSGPAKAIKAHLAASQVPAMLTVCASGRERVHAQDPEPAIKAMLTKPVCEQTLLQAIVSVFGEHHSTSKHIESFDVFEFDGRRVLVVDDNDLNREVATDLLERSGILVTEAIDGRDAIKKIAEQPFDLVLMDIQMPAMDGLMATQAIRADHRFRNLPIIAMTAHGMVGDRDKSLTAGMNDHVVKPIIAKQLTQTLLKWMPARNQPSLPAEAQPANDASQPAGLPACLPPLDLQGALARIHGNEQLLRRVLFIFRDKYSQAAPEMRQLLSRQGPDQARMLAHDIKGAAATIGAIELAKAAAALEDRLCQGQAQPTDPMITALENALGPVLAAIESIQV